MTARRTCRVCGCTERNACVSNGEACYWLPGRDDLCSACKSALKHPITMSGDPQHMRGASCECGWERVTSIRGAGGATVLDQAVRSHLLIVCEEAKAA